MSISNHIEFVHGLTRLFDNLPSKSHCLPGMFNEVYPVTQTLSSSEYSLLVDIGGCISVSVKKLVDNYLSSDEMRKNLPLTDKTIGLFKKLRDIPISNTLIRPDFIESLNKTPMICEIGTRFALNGYFASIFLQQTVSNLHPKYKLNSSVMFETLGLVSPNDEIIILVGDEVGYDIHYLAMEFKNTRFIHYTSEIWRETSESCTILLELNKDEVENILDALVDLMLAGRRIINDPRIVIIGHDKMLLKFLGDSEYMTPLVGDANAQLLNSHIIKTYSPEHDNLDISEKNKWIAKLKHGGKRIGMLVGSLVTQEEWDAVDSNYIIQPFIPQNLHIIYNHITRDSVPTYRVGMILNIGDECGGLGMYRFYSQKFEFIRFSGYTIHEELK
ncbi:hypothetical protein N9V31_03830 [Candidatus Poseidonia alphae]|nr:hypothetical protein [Candidatus Poseidonia alphae]